MHHDPIPALLLSVFLISVWKPVLICAAFLPWAWLISKLNADARANRLNPYAWNGAHLGAGFAALLVMLFVPIIYASWPLGVLVLLTPVLIYWKMRNAAVAETRRFYLTGATLSAKLEDRRRRRASKDAVIVFFDAKGKEHPLPKRDDPEYATHMLVEDLIGPAIEHRANRVEVVVGSGGVAVAQHIDGVRFKKEPPPTEDALRLIDYLKGYAGLDVEDRRRQQNGEFKIEGPEGKSLLSVATAGTTNSQVLRIDVDRAKALARPFEELGLHPGQQEGLEWLAELENRHGIVLIGAPPGHGLTTLSYSLLSRHDAYTTNIKTLEREVQLELDGVDHIQWDPTNPEVDYPTHLQSILRRDPDIVLVDLVKDQATAQNLVEPGGDGPLIYIPQRAGSVVDQMREWVKVVGNVKAATRGLRAVINARLVRKLCLACRQGYQPTEDQLRKLNLPAAKVEELFRASGKVQVKNKIEPCGICQGTGYRGQTGVFEVFLIDDEARKLLVTGDLKAALAHARRQKMIYLQEAALFKVVSGDTTIEEVIRMSSLPKGGAGAGAGSAQQAGKAATEASEAATS